MRRGGKLLITAQAGLACAALLGLALAVLRTHGLADARVSLGDGAAWLANASRGDAVLVSAASGEVLARASVGAPGDPITLVQHGPHALFLNAATGVVGRLDGAALTVTASTAFGAGAGAGAKVLTGGGGQLYLLDRDRGAAQALNPANLATLRTSEVPQGAAAAVVDAAGALWVADRASGTVISLRRGGPPRRVAVAEPGDELGLAVVTGHAVAVNGSRAVVQALPGGAQGRACLPVGGETGLLVTGDDAAPAAEGGRRAYALTPAGGELFVADLADGSCSSLPLGPGRYGQPRAVDGAVYVPDLATGRVLVLDAASGQIEATQVLPADTEFRLFVEDGLVWFDNPAGPEAGVL
ncbi:MAG: YncE family protein, partial [Acidimicrobiales bacterium]